MANSTIPSIQDLNGNIGIGTLVPNAKLDVAGGVDIQGNIRLTGTATTTNQGRMIDFTGFDKEGTTDPSDRAYITHTQGVGGHAGSVLHFSSQNDSGDGIAFTTHASSQLKHNGNTIWTSGNLTNVSQLTNDAGYTGDQDLDGYLLNTSDVFTGTLSIAGQLDVTGNFFSYIDGSSSALQRMDTREDATNYSRSHWYGIKDDGGTSNFRHAWYDGANYINVTAASGTATFGGNLAASNLSGTNTGDQDLTGYALTSDTPLFTWDSIADLSAPDASTGTWNTGATADWGKPRIGESVARFIDGAGDLSFTVPTGMKTAYISQLTWSSGGYADIYGIQADGDAIFLRRINTRQTVENNNHLNPNMHDGSTIAFAGHIGDYPTIRISNKSGRLHLTGLGFSKSEAAASDGTGMVHPSQLSNSIPYSSVSGTPDLSPYYSSNGGKYTIGTGNHLELKHTTPAGYSEMNLSNDSDEKLVIGSIGSEYTSTAWAGSRYIYSTAGELRIKAATNLRLYSGGHAHTSNLAVTFDSNQDATFYGNISATNLSGTNTGDQDLSGYLLNTADTFTGDLKVDNGRVLITNSAATGGGDFNPALLAYTATEQAYGRAQVLLASGYSDITIGSSQANDNHGSTLTFATVNPADGTDYRKFVIGQGNWGARSGYLDFGYDGASESQNPHGYINSSDVSFTVDGVNNRIGLNAMSPTHTLDVNGNAHISTTLQVDGTINSASGGTFDSLGVANSSASTKKGISLYGGHSTGEPTYGLMFSGTSSSGTHGFVSGDWATYFTMSNTSNRGWIFRRAGVGNSASISANGHATFNQIKANDVLTVYKNADVWHTIIGGASGELRIGGQTGAGAVIQSRTSNGTTRDLYIQRDGGNVGIGTTSSQHKLHIKGTGTILNLTSTTSYVDMIMQVTGNTGYLNLDSTKMNFYVGGGSAANNKMSILTTGKVGIGTQSPNAKLTVVGTTTGEVVLDIQGTQGQLFSVTDNLEGDLFSVADVSGVPILNVNASGTTTLDGPLGIRTENPNAELNIIAAMQATEDSYFKTVLNIGSTAAPNDSVFTVGVRNDGYETIFGQNIFFPGTGTSSTNSKPQTTRSSSAIAMYNSTTANQTGTTVIGGYYPIANGGTSAFVSHITVNGTGAVDFSSGLTIPNNIYHLGDTDTYYGFHAANQWRVVTAGAERLEVSSEVKVTGTLRWGATDNYVYSNVDATGTYIESVAPEAGKGAMRFQTRTLGAGSYTSYKLSAEDLTHRWVINGTERMKLDGNSDLYLNDGGLTVVGHQSRGSYVTLSNYKTGADNIVLKGNSVGRSGIFFESVKNGTNINHPSDFGFIQYHAYGTGTTGESSELIIGTSNDADDHVVLNAPDINGIKMRVGVNNTTDHTVYHSGNLTNNNQLTNGNSYITAAGTTNGNVKQIGTTSGDIDADWGTSFKTFDPIPTGTPPIQSPNIRTVNIGENFSRRTQLAFNYSTDQAWFRRRHDSTWHSWKEFLHSGTSTVTFVDTNTSFLDITAGNNYGIRFWGGSTNYVINMSSTADATHGGACSGAASSDYNMYFKMAGGTNRGFAFKNGTSVKAMIQGDGTFRSVSDVIAYSSSDKRLKDNINNISDPIGKIKQISGVEFDWNSNQIIHTAGTHDIGVIAQEIEKVLPEIVTTRENGYKAVKYEKLTAVLIEGIKEQQSMLDKQQIEIEKLKELVGKLVNNS